MNKKRSAPKDVEYRLDWYWEGVMCQRCGKNMGARWSIQGKRKFCDNACRQAAYRSRLVTKPLQ